MPVNLPRNQVEYKGYIIEKSRNRDGFNELLVIKDIYILHRYIIYEGHEERIREQAKSWIDQRIAGN